MFYLTCLKRTRQLKSPSALWTHSVKTGELEIGEVASKATSRTSHLYPFSLHSSNGGQKAQRWSKVLDKRVMSCQQTTCLAQQKTKSELQCEKWWQRFSWIFGASDQYSQEYSRGESEYSSRGVARFNLIIYLINYGIVATVWSHGKHNGR